MTDADQASPERLPLCPTGPGRHPATLPHRSRLSHSARSIASHPDRSDGKRDHQLDSIHARELLLPLQRAPGVKRERVPDR